MEPYLGALPLKATCPYGRMGVGLKAWHPSVFLTLLRNRALLLVLSTKTGHLMKHYSILQLRLFWHHHGHWPDDAYPDEISSMERLRSMERSYRQTEASCLRIHGSPGLSRPHTGRLGRVLPQNPERT